MRDPARIERIGKKLLEAWAKYPDWRLGQLVSNLIGPGRQNVFGMEDNMWEALLDKELGIKHKRYRLYTGSNGMLEAVKARTELFQTEAIRERARQKRRAHASRNRGRG